MILSKHLFGYEYYLLLLCIQRKTMTIPEFLGAISFLNIIIISLPILYSLHRKTLCLLYITILNLLLRVKRFFRIF